MKWDPHQSASKSLKYLAALSCVSTFDVQGRCWIEIHVTHVSFLCHSLKADLCRHHLHPGRNHNMPWPSPPSLNRPAHASRSCQSQGPHVEGRCLRSLYPSGYSTTASSQGTTLLMLVRWQLAIGAKANQLEVVIFSRVRSNFESSLQATGKRANMVWQPPQK